MSAQPIVSVPQGWEYTCFDIWSTVNTQQQIDELNKWGAAKWEAVGVTSFGDGPTGGFFVLLKRPLTS